MRQTVAKRLRKKVYGDMAKKEEYGFLRHLKTKTKDGKKIRKFTGQAVCMGLRKKYLDAKKEYYLLRHSA